MNSKYKILITGAGFLVLTQLKIIVFHSIIGIDNMIGGYEDNINNIEFHKLDCCDLSKIRKVMKGVDVVYHCATAHKGLSVFSPYEITNNSASPYFYRSSKS